MKKYIVLLIFLLSCQSIFAQKIILHRNSGGDQTFQLSSIDSISFLPFACGDEVRYEGQTYHTLLIGTQCWMKENLNVGSMIDGSLNQTNNPTIEKYCYNNDVANCTIYGGLYQWDEAMQYVNTEGAQGLCPDGWHIPALSEYQILQTSVMNDGNALKEIGQGTGTNTSGFSAMLAGYRYFGGEYFYIDEVNFLYTSTQGSETQAYYLYLVGTSSNMEYYNNHKPYGMTIRCLKDQ